MKLQFGVFLCIIAASSSNLLGGFRTVDVKEDGVSQVVDWTMEHYNRMINSLNHHVLLSIVKASRQVVNGYRYHFVLNLAPSTCRNNAENMKKTITECPVQDNGQVRQCEVTVGVSHDQKYSLQKDFDCNTDESIHILGGDDHDYVPHTQQKKSVEPQVLGKDGHDYLPHAKNDQPQVLGKDGHDYLPHAKNDQPQVLGKDGHDYLPHTKIDSHLLFNRIAGVRRNAQPAVHHMSILGGGDHDYKPHHGDHCVAQYAEKFKQFKGKYNRLYGSYKEEAKRFQIFCANMDRVEEYQKQEKGSAKYGATIFADISEEEFRKTHMGFNTDVEPGRVWPAAEIPKMDIPDNFDWREHGAVTEVKNQGSCGSCWAFSTTGNIEGQHAIKNSKLISLSEQELVDCDKTDLGCEGGLPSQAYVALEKLGGIESEKDYNYVGADEKCHFNKSKVQVKVTGALNISQDEGEMAAWLFKNGPISIGINAFAMQFYFGGITHPWRIFCNPKKLDHGVLIVGFGVRSNEPYWIVKNSWGPGWGEKGYYLVYRGDGVCGLNTMCTSAVVG